MISDLVLEKRDDIDCRIIRSNPGIQFLLRFMEEDRHLNKFGFC